MRRWLPFLILLPAFLAQANERAERVAVAAVAEFKAAFEQWDGAQFDQAAKRLRESLSLAPDSATCLYWLGVVEFHRMLQLETAAGAATNRAEVETAMESAIDALSRALELNATNAETHALLGTLYGMKINGNWLRAAKYGPAVQKHMKRAMAYGATDPRVLYLLGTCQFHTAKKAAARREALGSFLEAEKLFAAEAQRPAGPLEPRWGRSSCLTFIARSYELLGETTPAASYFRKALELHPADRLARDGLARLAQTK